MKLKIRKTYPAIINDEEVLKKAINDFGLNYVKASKHLKNNKDIALMAVKEDPFNVMYMKDISPEVADEVKKRKEYLNKYIDPLSTVVDFNKPLTEYEVRLMNGEKLAKRNAEHEALVNEISDIGKILGDFER